MTWAEILKLPASPATMENGFTLIDMSFQDLEISKIETVSSVVAEHEQDV